MERMPLIPRLVRRVTRLLLHPVWLGAISVAATAALYAAENHISTVPFAAAMMFLTASVVFALSARPAFSIYTALAAFGTITLISAIKFKLKGFSLHFYDIVFAGNDPEVIRFLWTEFGSYIVPVAVVALAAVLFLACVFLLDRKRSPARAARTVPVLVFAGLLPATYPAEAYVEQRYFYYMQGRHTSAFFVSLLDLSYVFDTGELEKRLARFAPQPAFADTVDCGPGPLPDILVVLGESQINPGDLPGLEGGAEIAHRMFTEGGRPQPLYVETYGGGTWISNLSVMTGLSATDFGWRSPYLTIELEGRIRDSLPQVLKRCGYHTAAVLPMKYGFVNEGPFLSSIGFETIVDLDAMKAPTYHLRDSAYFDAASKVAAEHRARDARPLFLAVQTMFAHSPFEERMAPDVVVEGEPLHQDREVAEYLRRLMIARADFAEMVKSFKKDQGARGTVVVSFGDHHSFVTRRFVEDAGGDALSVPNSLAYRTFYTVEASKNAMGGERDATTPPIDIAFLSNRILDAAGIPGSPLFKDLRALETTCDGRFFTCRHRHIVDRHLRRRIDSGLLRLELPTITLSN